MDGIINVRVNGYSLVKDGNCAGAQHESNSTKLRIEFSNDWIDFEKKVTFWNALGLNPVAIILLPDLLEDINDKSVYLVSIPGEAMTEAGMISFVIDGYLDGARKRSVEDRLKVLPSRKAGEPEKPTPTEVEQLQKSINDLTCDIADAFNARDVAIAKADEAESYSTLAKESENDAQTYAEQAQNAVGKTNYIGENGNWYAWDSRENVFYDTGVKAQSGSTVYYGENPPEDADVWIDPNGEALDVIPVMKVNTNTVVTKDGDHTIGENCDDGLVIGRENIYNEGKYSVIFGVDNEVTGHSNVVSGSENKVKGLHNLVVGNKLNVTDDGTAQVIFGLGEDVPIPKDVAIAYYNLGKPAFKVTKDGDLTLNDKDIASIPACDVFDDTYVLKSETTNVEYSMDKVVFVGADEHTHRLVVNNMPEVSEDWIGYTIEFTHINEDGTVITESTRIRNIEGLDTNQPIISIDEEITNMTDDTKTYWDSFIIRGVKYVWDKMALIPQCESNTTEEYLPVYANVNEVHSISDFRLIGSNATQYRLVIDKPLIPNLSKDWIGLTIEFFGVDANAYEKTTIRDIEDNGADWIIVIDKTISHMDSEDNPTEYWANFGIKGNKYVWDNKPTVDQKYNPLSTNAQSGKAVAEVEKAVAKTVAEVAKTVAEVEKTVAEEAILSNKERAPVLPCSDAKRGNYILESNFKDSSNPITALTTVGNTAYCDRLVVSKTEIPEISKNWIGLTIEFKNANADFAPETAKILYVSQRTDNEDEWNIDIEKGVISNIGSVENAKEHWTGGFEIYGMEYNWKSKTELFEEIKKYIQNN